LKIKKIGGTTGMKMVELGKCCKIISGSTPSRNIPEFWDGDIHWFTPKDLSGLASKYVYEAPEKITKEGFKSCSTNLIPSNSLLFSSRAPIGHLAINKLDCCTNQGFKTMIPSENLDVEYLYYAIKRIVPQLQDMGNGATFKELSKSIFEKVVIPLPPLSTQKKIAAILDAADVYRQKTKTLIEKYDQLAQSLFLDMFGDPVRNPKGWKVNLLGELTKDMKYGTNCKSDETETEGSIAIIRIPNIQPGFIDYSDLKYSKLPEEELKKVKLKRGDLLFVRSNGNPEYIGRCAYFNSDKIVAAYASYLIRVRLLRSDIVSPLFVSFIFNYKSYRNRVLREARTTAGNYNLNTQGLKGFEIIIPPITLQNQFAERIQLIEAQKQQAQASLQKAEDLFNSLLQRAFKGELVS
jgi:type I restriction enzyme, S subunit